MTEAAEARWLVLVEVDPAWFVLKGALAEHPCPPPSRSSVVVGGPHAVVGRTSRSRGVVPDVPLDADTGVSRRHAQLVCADEQVLVVDLSSTNGTYVVPAGDVPSARTQPLVPGVPAELAPGDRVYLGAWSCLTLVRRVDEPVSPRATS